MQNARGPMFDRLAQSVSQVRPDGSPHPAIAQRDNLLRRMRIVAKARFAANKRLDAKGAATNFGLQTANLYTIGIGILLLQYYDATLIQQHQRSLNYISLVASVFVQIIALIETYKDYSGKARSMHECAVEINRICQELELEPSLAPQSLAKYQERYGAAIKDFDVNHDPIDFLSAQLEPDRQKTRSTTEKWAVRRWWVRYIWNVYAFTLCILVLPWGLFFLLNFLGLG